MPSDKLVIVLEEHTLGVVCPNGLQILRSSVLRGASWTICPGLCGFNPILDKFRLASHQDFDDFGVSDSHRYLN